MKLKLNLLFLMLTPLLFTNCTEESVTNDETKQANVKSSKEERIDKTQTPKKEYLQKYYQLDHIKSYYDWNEMTGVDAPPFDYKKDLTSLSYEELRLLRNEIFARNGYLFNDAFLRGYFNQFKWYKPIFDVPEFKVSLDKEEQDFISEVKKEEAKRKANKTVERESLSLYNADLIVNTKQFKAVPTEVLEDFGKQNFSIVNANRSMPFYAYDNNAYQHIPNYVTTDLYLFILHRYFSRFIEKFEENYLSKELKGILKKTFEKLATLSTHKNEVEWAQTYCALALHSFGDQAVKLPESYTEIYQEEVQKIENAGGKPSFIQNETVNFGDLKPRSHYTKSEPLRSYFKSFKWISLNGIDISNNEELKGLITLAFTIKNDPNLYKKYQKYSADIEKLAGKEDNISIRDLIALIDVNSLDEALEESKVAQIQEQLMASSKERIKVAYFTPSAEEDKKRLFFFSSTYSISGEIFSKLINVKRDAPKALDVAAVFGNKTAEKILLEEYKENEKWPAYTSNLQQLQNQFESFSDWDHNYGFKGVESALASFAEQENYPNFMKTDAYNRKELSTALSSWTHIKHDLVLYQERPYAAEAGEGGGPEPPSHYSYVEPNIVFWNTAKELVSWLEILSENKETTFESELQKIKEVGNLLRKVANKQLNGENVSKEEYQKLHFIGAEIEYILLGLLETDHLPTRESSMALIADVYANKSGILNVAVGHADDIYVIVPFKGEYHIARGSTFSFYEFQSDGVLNDEDWRKKVGEKNVPKRPEWIAPLVRNVETLEGNMEYRYPRYVDYD
ncbi:DUF3160 domain-containing protein [Flammeovirga aprica]|uniref:DUF3160 domain-containing protein n=1 Tax=Flammeovirga aprica JL-4 TaxID=694437 RepID=A0A7X9RYI8_9BACT|nr:DUF3160 domain-containing protein [Flammeovirga aprica]NME71086.1 DUF3160 domain-containing protein [Flammeovirga aprica JL-4]